MPRAHVRQNQIDYTAQFERPAFGLWGRGGTILEGLYTAFQGFHGGLKDIVAEGSSEQPANHGVVVNFGWQTYYRFRLDRVEARASNFRDADLATLSQILQRGQDWIRSVISCR